MKSICHVDPDTLVIERAVVASDSVTRLSLQLEFVCLIKKGTI